MRVVNGTSGAAPSNLVHLHADAQEITARARSAMGLRGTGLVSSLGNPRNPRRANHESESHESAAGLLTSASSTSLLRTSYR
jgi:hypothetical protein